MSTYTHGQQQFDYAWVPTYFLSGTNSNLGSFEHSFLDWDKREDWTNRTANDGAVTLRSQCGGNWTCDHNTCTLPPADVAGNSMESQGARLCQEIEEHRATVGYGYGHWFPANNYASPLVDQAWGCVGTQVGTDRYTCSAGNHTGSGGRGDMRRIAVQWMTDVW
jgi:hypothetical protein